MEGVVIHARKGHTKKKQVPLNVAYALPSIFNQT
jgi:hypothetical protein